MLLTALWEAYCEDIAAESLSSICQQLPESCDVRPSLVRMYDTYMANKTISVPDDVLPIIDGLGVPFSRWVTDQLRRHAALSGTSFADQLRADAELSSPDSRPTRRDAVAAGKRMGQTAPW